MASGPTFVARYRGATEAERWAAFERDAARWAGWGCIATDASEVAGGMGVDLVVSYDQRPTWPVAHWTEPVADGPAALALPAARPLAETIRPETAAPVRAKAPARPWRRKDTGLAVVLRRSLVFEGLAVWLAANTLVPADRPDIQNVGSLLGLAILFVGLAAYAWVLRQLSTSQRAGVVGLCAFFGAAFFASAVAALQQIAAA